MSDRTATVDRRTGAAALTAGVLMFVSVATELVRNVQRPDGSVSDMPVFVLFIGGFAVGTATLGAAIQGLGGVPLSGAGWIGRALSLAGAGLVTVFAVCFLATGVTTGTPLEALFWLFLLGFLLLIVGSVPLGLSLRRSGIVGTWWLAVLVAGAGALVAMLTLSPGTNWACSPSTPRGPRSACGCSAPGRTTGNRCGRPDPRPGRASRPAGEPLPSGRAAPGGSVGSARRLVRGTPSSRGRAPGRISRCIGESSPCPPGEPPPHRGRHHSHPPRRDP